jgi:peroxiredoxin
VFKLFFALLLLFSCTQDSLPRIKVKELGGRSLYLTELKGKKTLIYVWSRTCAGHSKDLRELNKMVGERRDYRIVSYAVAMEEEDVKKSYKELGIEPKFITLVDTEVKLGEYFPITFLPSTYLFDERGRLVKSVPGLGGF